MLQRLQISQARIFASLMSLYATMGRSTGMNPDSARSYQLEADEWAWKANLMEMMQ